MNRRFLKICSWFLCFVLLVNMLPMSIFAEEFQKNLAEKATLSASAENLKAEPLTVVDELTEKRTKYGKEFLLSSGLHMAVVYPDAVHYEEAGEWREIDNTLVAKTDGILTNTAGEWKVSFPQQMTKSQGVTIEKDGYTLSFAMADELRSTGLEVATAESNLSTAAMTEQAETLAVGVMQNTTAKIEQIDLSAAKEAAEFEEAVPQKLQSRLKYANVFANTDVTYDLDSNRVKESVILQSYNSSLRGYRYTLNVGTLRPILEEDGQITFYDEKQENVVMVMPAPYLLDNAQEMNTDIQVRLTGSGSTYTLTYVLPQQWLAAEERQWPVILDPVVVGDTAKSNIQDVTVSEGKTYDHKWGMLQCGHSTTYGLSQFYVKYDELPAITSSDVVVSASMSLYKHEAGNNYVVEARKVSTTWTAEGMTWSNKPDFGSHVEDYAVVGAEGYWHWNITDAVREWYANANTGIMFKLTNADEASSLHNIKQFRSVDYGYNRPLLAIYFRNNNGLESYWDYLSASAGRSGTGHVNKYTGNLTWTRELMGFGGNRMPVSITQTYNANDALAQSDENNSNDTAGHSFGMGRGWRTNYHQLVYQWSEDNNYYIWEDSDGTDHYFEYSSSNTYKDEDGLELTLTTNGSGTQKYCIKNKNGECWYFDTNGRLTQITNNQATKSSVNITYTNATGRKISQITDGVGRKYNFSYTNNGYLAEIVYTGKGTEEITKTRFGYTGIDQSYVLDKDGKATWFTCNSNGLLTSVQDIDGYKLSYTYNTVSDPWQPYRITSVTETDGSAQGSALTLAYAHNQTTVTDHQGNVEIYQFNDFGNVVTVQDDEGRTANNQYAKNRDDDAGKGNQLKVASKLQNTVANLLKDSSFESSTDWIANIYPAAPSVLSASRSTEQEYHGSYSLKVFVGQYSTSHGAYSPTFQVQPNETFTYSAYIMNPDAEATIAFHYQDANGSYRRVSSEPIAPSSEWVRKEVTFTNTTSNTLTVRAFFFTPNPGNYYIDCVQVEKTETASRYNLIENGDFGQGGSPALRWTGTSLTSSDKIVTDSRTAAPNLSTSVFSITGNPTGKKQLSYTINHSGAAGDCYVFGGWAWSDKPMPEYNLYNASEDPSRFFQIRLTLKDADGVVTEAIAKFNTGSRRWQYTGAACAAKEDYTSITLTIEYNYNANVVWFDGIQLFKEAFGTSYTYDEDGNIIAVQDLQGRTTHYEYNEKNDLTKVSQGEDEEMTYTYDDYHNVKTAVSKAGVRYEFTYDTYGNQTRAGVVTDTQRIEDWSYYSADGNRLTRVQDRLNRDTYYSYNEQTNVLEWVQYPTNTADNRTNYTYDAMYRTTKISAALTNPLAVESQSTTENQDMLSVNYTYTDDYLTQVLTASTAYNFTYGNFGLRQSVKVGDTPLATYRYTNDRNNYLAGLDFGNQDSINYTYDDKGRLLTQTYEDGDTLTHTYDNSGNLATVTDSATGRKTTYYYDLTDRLMKTVETGENYLHSVEYTYDAKNNLTQQVENINGTKRTVSYSYDKDNRVTEASDGTVSVHYTYDGYGRVSKKETKNGGTNIKTEEYTFQDLRPNDIYTSDVISTYKLTIRDEQVVTYSYTYDNNGNILTVSDGTNTISYTYDSANQLVQEQNSQTGTHTWSYDNAGNITAADNVVYAYENEEWKDQLTNYNGREIEYDLIGNPTNDGIWNYTWEHGRQLAAMSNGSATWSYTYDADGLRTGRTNGTDTYSYVYNGGSLSKLTKGSDTLYFTYDANGTPLTVNYNGTVYYYVTNLQGDVVKILNSSGTAVAAYTYDAWGKPLSTSGTMVDTLGQINPLRYRGYIYDTETGLYYLQSRYYNPEMGRFINGDAQISDIGGEILGYNMFAYCMNNPVNSSDPTGNWPSWSTVLKAAAIAVTAVAVVAAVAVTVATFGATSIAATIVVSSAITIAAKATEVAVLQGKKSASEGKNTGQVATDIIESVFDNGVGTGAKTAVTKTAGYATGFYSQSSSFQDVMKLQKMDGYNLKTLAGAATHEIANRFTDLKYCVSAKASTGSMLISYGFAGLNVVNTVISIFADDPVQRATSRGYTLK